MLESDNPVVYPAPAGLLIWCRMLRRVRPAFPGKTRLGKALLGPYLPLREITVRANDSAFLVPTLQEPIAFHLLIDGVYEQPTAKFLSARLRSGSTFVDIGANIGSLCVAVAKRVGRHGQVLAIEPSPLVFRYLQHNARLNGLSNIRLKECAVSDRESEKTPFYEAPIEKFGMGALAAQFQGQAISVQTRTLDSLLQEEHITHVDVLKVDVEGSEAAVFRGAKGLLTGPNPPLVLFEFCDWAEARTFPGHVGAAQMVLRDYGYKLWRLKDFGRSKRRPLRTTVVNGSEMLVAALL